MSQIAYYVKYIALGFLLAVVSAPFTLANDMFPVSVLLLAAPPLYALYRKRSSRRDLEANFRVFLDDLKDLLQAGISVSVALQVLSKGRYGPLTPYAKRIAALVQVGVPFEKAMEDVFVKIRSPTISKIVSVVNETHRAGGNLIKIFSSAASYVEKTEQLKAERRSTTQSTVFNSYLMFFVFVGIVIGIQVFFLPIFQQGQTPFAGQTEDGTVAPPTETAETSLQGANTTDFSQFFQYLIIIQAIFAGPMIGKISENSLVAGIKHSIILLFISLTVYLGSISLFGIA